MSCGKEGIMIDGTIMRYNCTWFYLRKKHVCPNCNTVLERKKREVVVNSQSEEAKNYDFFIVDTYLHGKIKFITFFFACPNCRTVYEIRELKKLEKSHKKRTKSGSAS